METKEGVTMILSGGGTGGHVYPALAVAEAIRREAALRGQAEPDLLFMGTRRGPEADLAPRAGLEFHPVSAGAMRSRNPFRMLGGGAALLLGILQAWRTIGRERANAVFATGGYASIPAGLAARLRHKPLVVYLP